MPTDGKIQLSYGGYSVEITQPEEGYRTSINFPFDMQELDNNATALYDPDSGGNETYDIRQCTAKFMLTADEENNLIAFFNDPDKGRGRDVTLSLNTGSGFYPFGPDKGDAGNFTVSVDIGKHGSQTNAPWKYFEREIILTNTGSYPAYSLPSETGQGEGGFTIGTISENRFPLNWFAVDGNYGIITVIDQGADANYIDRGSGADFWRTSFNMISNTAKAAAVINYIAKTARAANFNIVADSNYYPFGRANSDSGTYTVRLVQDKIEITHSLYNQFQYTLDVEYVSGP